MGAHADVLALIPLCDRQWEMMIPGRLGQRFTGFSCHGERSRAAALGGGRPPAPKSQLHQYLMPGVEKARIWFTAEGAVVFQCAERSSAVDDCTSNYLISLQEATFLKLTSAQSVLQ